MARKLNDNRTKTPVMIDKSLKLQINRLRNKDQKREGNESDNTVLTRVIGRYIDEHPGEVHDPKTTYVSKA